MSSIPGCGIGVREKIVATPSVGVGGKTHVHRNKRTDWVSSKKQKKLNTRHKVVAAVDAFYLQTL